MGGTQSKKKTPPPKPAISSVDRAVLDLKVSRDRLSKYKSRLEKDDAKLLQRAKAAKASGQTVRALNLLRLRAYKRAEADNVEQQLLTVLTMVNTIDSKQNEQHLLQSLKTGKEALAKLQQATPVEEIVDLMDAIAEQNQYEQEIAQVLQSNNVTLTNEQEAEVEAELEELMAETAATTTLPVAPDTQLPDAMPTAPNTKLPDGQKLPQNEGKLAVAL